MCLLSICQVNKSFDSEIFVFCRMHGFYLTVAVSFFMATLGLIGVLSGILHKYFHIHLERF